MNVTTMLNAVNTEFLFGLHTLNKKIQEWWCYFGY